MSESKKRYRVFISAAEPSADAHCANLIGALKNTGAAIDFVGAGGPKMAGAGCELLENTVEKASMIYNALANIAYFHKLIKRIKIDAEFEDSTRYDSDDGKPDYLNNAF